MINKPIVFFDIETTGVSTTADEITQLAAVTVLGEKVLSTFEVKIKPSEKGIEKLKLMPEGVCTYDPDEWGKRGMPAAQAFNKFSNYLRDYTWVQMTSKAGRDYKVALLAGHNVIGFDKEFIFRYAKDLNIFLPADMRMLDTLPIFLEYCAERGLSMKKLTLEAFIDQMGVVIDGPAHDALVDARANALAYIELCRRRDVKRCSNPRGDTKSEMSNSADYHDENDMDIEHPGNPGNYGDN